MAVLKFGLRDPRTGEYSPLRSKQREFWENRRNYRYCLNGGDFSSGKTAANLYCCAEDIVTALQLGVHPMSGRPFSVILVHKKLAWANAALMEPLRGILPSRTPDGIALWFRNSGDANENRWRYGSVDNCCTISIIGLDRTSVDPVEFARSSENFDLAIVSQGDILSEEVLWALDVRVGRRPLPSPLRGQQLWDSNATKNFLYRIFIKRNVSNADPAEFYSLLSTVEDMGDVLSEDFRKKMSQRSESRKRMARDWDYAPGQAFPEYDKRVSWIQFESIPFEGGWTLKEAMDWGYAIHPAFYLWYCTDFAGNVFFIDELELYRHDAIQQEYAVRCKREQLISEIASRIGNPVKDQERMYAGSYGGPDLNMKESGLGKTKGDQLREAGLRVRVVNPDVSGVYEKEESKVTAFASALRVDSERRHPVTGKLGSSRVYISSRCERLSEQIETVMIDVDNPKRIDKSQVTNRFAEGQVHHWDAVDAAFIALQENRVPLADSVREEECWPKDWAYGRKFRRKYSRATDALLRQ